MKEQYNEVKCITGKNYEKLDWALNELSGINIGEVALDISQALIFSALSEKDSAIMESDTLMADAFNERLVINLLPKHSIYIFVENNYHREQIITY